MSAPTVDLSLPDDQQLLTAANPNPRTEAARLTDTGNAERVADLGRGLQRAGAELDDVHRRSWQTQRILAGGLFNNGVSVYDAAAHRQRLPAGFADAGVHLDAVGRRVGAVSDELATTIGELTRMLDELTGELSRRRSGFTAEVDAARGPGGLIPLDVLSRLQARRQAVAADMQELVDTCGRKVLGRIGVYQVTLNDCQRLLDEFDQPAGSTLALRLEGETSGFSVPAPTGPTADVQPGAPRLPGDRGFVPAPAGPGPLITLPAPGLGTGVQDGPESAPGVPRTQVDASASPGNPVAGGRPHQGNFPRTAQPNEILVRRGDDGKVNSYEVYGPDGQPVKRVDVRGRAHGGIDTPHVQEFDRNVNPVTGEEFVNPGRVRAATPDEVASLL